MIIVHGADLTLAVWGLLCAALFFGLQWLCFRSERRHFWYLPLAVLLCAIAICLAAYAGLLGVNDFHELAAWFTACVFAIGGVGVALAWLLYHVANDLKRKP